MDLSALIAPADYKTDTVRYQSNDKTLDILHMNSLFDKMETETLIQHMAGLNYTASESKIVVFGKEVEIPRMQIGFGDRNCIYRFPGYTGWGNKWQPWMHTVRNRVSEYLQDLGIYVHPGGVPIPNHLFINYYETGQSSIGFHRDKVKDMKEIGGENEYVIATVSVGGTRRFLLQRKSATAPENDIKQFELPGCLKDGDILVMQGLTNHVWKHSVPKMANADSRWCLIFRFARLQTRPDSIPYE